MIAPKQEVYDLSDGAVRTHVAILRPSHRFGNVCTPFAVCLVAENEFYILSDRRSAIANRDGKYESMSPFFLSTEEAMLAAEQQDLANEASEKKAAEAELERLAAIPPRIR